MPGGLSQKNSSLRPWGDRFLIDSRREQVEFARALAVGNTLDNRGRVGSRGDESSNTDGFSKKKKCIDHSLQSSANGEQLLDLSFLTETFALSFRVSEP